MIPLLQTTMLSPGLFKSFIEGLQGFQKQKVDTKPSLCDSPINALPVSMIFHFTENSGGPCLRFDMKTPPTNPCRANDKL